MDDGDVERNSGSLYNVQKQDFYESQGPPTMYYHFIYTKKATYNVRYYKKR